jgi:hypothetical protein
MEYCFEKPDVISVEADISTGWHHLTHTYGFCQRITVDAIDFLVQVAVHAWPNRIGVHAEEFPREATAQFRHLPNPILPLISYELSDGRISLHISVPDSRLARLPRARRPGFYFEPMRLWGPRRLGYWLSVLAYFLDSRIVNHPDILEFDTQFYSGGLPELGKRH